jgi:hypothetical protein
VVLLVLRQLKWLGSNDAPFGYLGRAPTLSSISLSLSNSHAKLLPIIPISPRLK